MNDKEKIVARLEGKPICPKCKEPISYLQAYEEVGFDLRIEDDELDEGVHDYIDGSFKVECPECNEILTECSEEAEEILRGK